MTKPCAGSSTSLVFFLINSIAIQMVVGQDAAIERFSSIYWALVLFALALPLFCIREIFRLLLGRGILLLAFLLCAGGYQLARGDLQVLAQLLLMVWVTAWCGCESTRITVSTLTDIFLGTLLMGVIVAMLTNLNPWGLFPGQTSAGYGPWRTSFFPHIANSATMSLVMLMILTRSTKQHDKKGIIALTVACYFGLFGFVRTVLVAAVIYFSLFASLAKVRPRPVLLIFTALGVILASIAVELAIAPFLEKVQDSPIVSRLLLRSASDLDSFAINQQLYRPWLWKEHMKIFVSSPYLMGLGNFRLLDHVSYNLVPGLEASGSESFPTRLLATYGISALLFLGYLTTFLIRAAYSRDFWACACFPVIVFVMMNWGSVFHPTNAFFVLFILMMRGDKAIC
ncbi:MULTISPECIES: hypothetical protein [unclassified Bradyrhizobium]|uniref:hypothetical protein n=1 Tax=unclassified Bradyrhizobium TaxID=2631580 RepID=UPI00070EA0F7|nr:MULTISPECIES: hypothetical protein [unclassified Bradyrhizobium]KQT13077.1 hypothetical protein ASG57_34505 [Bradyrhizobium sp. Leaf396]